MDFEKFVKKVKDGAQAYLGDGVSLSVSTVLKNNGVNLTGIIFMDGDSDVASTIYLDGLYEEYKRGKTMGEIVRQVCRVYEENKPEQNLNMDFFHDYKMVKPRLACRLINCEKNQELLGGHPHREFLDLAIVYCCILMSDNMGCACVLISDMHARYWDVDEETLYRDALENMPRILPDELSDMDDFMYDIVRKAVEEKLELTAEGEKTQEDEECRAILDGIAEFLAGLPLEKEPERKMYILTNKQHFYGAAVILYPGILESYAGKLGHDFYILPSSVHEVILLADTGVEDREHLYDMVREVNAQNVPEEELLSDNVYYFSLKSGKITIL